MQKLNINNNSSNDTISEITNNSSIGNNNKDKHSNQYSRINYMILKRDTLVIYNSYQIKRVYVCIKLTISAFMNGCYGPIKCK